MVTATCGTAAFLPLHEVEQRPAGDRPFQQSQLGQEMWGAGLQPLAEAPGTVTGAGQDGEQSCWLFQSLHCTGPINQMGRCSKLLMVGLNVFLTGAMP